MRFSIAKTALAAIVTWASLTAFDTSSAHAGIIITIGDSPLLSSAQIKRYLALHRKGEEAGGDEGCERARSSDEFARPAAHGQQNSFPSAAGYKTRSQTCQSTQTGRTERCPRPNSPEVDGRGLPTEWSCFAIRPGVFYCDSGYYGASADAGMGGYAGDGDFVDEELTVMGCSGGSGSASWMLAFLAIGGLALTRKKRSQDA